VKFVLFCFFFKKAGVFVVWSISFAVMLWWFHLVLPFVSLFFLLLAKAQDHENNNSRNDAKKKKEKKERREML
jgi:hypothetical protein